MARLGPESDWVMQMPGDELAVLSNGAEDLVKFNPKHPQEWFAAAAELVAVERPRLSPHEMAAAHFWAGYFYAHAVRA